MWHHVEKEMPFSKGVLIEIAQVQTAGQHLARRKIFFLAHRSGRFLPKEAAEELRIALFNKIKGGIGNGMIEFEKALSVLPISFWPSEIKAR